MPWRSFLWYLKWKDSITFFGILWIGDNRNFLVMIRCYREKLVLWDIVCAIQFIEWAFRGVRDPQKIIFHFSERILQLQNVTPHQICITITNHFNMKNNQKMLILTRLSQQSWNLWVFNLYLYFNLRESLFLRILFFLFFHKIRIARS